ncbi:MAG TPA: acetylxylan esterase [bacterium]|nr:acetylxylan esterase [bacterium]HPN42743.1 acetylxylan esterase [bacterium]
MNKKQVLIFITGVFFICSFRLFPQTPPFITAPVNDQSNNIFHYLNRVAALVTETSLAGFATLPEWEAARPQRYAEFIDMMSLADQPLYEPRCPLNVTITGTIQKSGYRIEKLYYESLPSLYVVANLYIPQGLEKPVPAILYVCGHAETQKVHYQAHARRFAELGFVCLIIETIQWGEVRGEHWGTYARGWFHWLSRGYTPAGVELWNALRGIDLLCARPEVDSDKIGVTGTSGGGAQTWFIAAADPRIKAAAPSCGTSTVKAHIFHNTIDGHCDCMMPVNTCLRDIHDIGALIAPRPLLVAAADRDGLNTIDATRECVQYIKQIYELYDKGEQIELVETPGGHSYQILSRTKIMAFFLRYLYNKEIPYTEIDDIDTTAAGQFSAVDLRVYKNGPPPDDRTCSIQETFIKTATPPVITNKEDLAVYRAKVIDFLREKTFRAFPDAAAVMQPRLEFRTLDDAPFGHEVYSFVSETDWRLKIDIYRRHPWEESAPLLVILRSPGENRTESERWVEGFDERYNLAFLDVRGVGETGWNENMQWHIRRALAWTGRTIASMQVYDVLRGLEFLRSLEGFDSAAMCLAARGALCAPLVYAALLDGGIDRVFLENPPATQNQPSQPDGRGDAIEMLNCLRITDLPQAAGLLYPAEIIIVGSIPVTWNWCEAVYNSLGKADNFHKVARITDWGK